MKKFTYSVAIAATLLASSNTFAQQGFGTNTPHKSSAVEIKSSNKGLLIPRVTLSALTGTNSKLNPNVDNANSLLVYNLGSTAIPAGYYYWDQPEGQTNGTWVQFATADGAEYTGENGITVDENNVVKLGGTAITENTILNITSESLNIQNTGGAINLGTSTGTGTITIEANSDKLFIKGVQDVAPTITTVNGEEVSSINLDAYNVLLTNASGQVWETSASALVSEGIEWNFVNTNIEVDGELIPNQLTITINDVVKNVNIINSNTLTNGTSNITLDGVTVTPNNQLISTVNGVFNTEPFQIIKENDLSLGTTFVDGVEVPALISTINGLPSNSLPLSQLSGNTVVVDDGEDVNLPNGLYSGKTVTVSTAVIDQTTNTTTYTVSVDPKSIVNLGLDAINGTKMGFEIGSDGTTATNVVKLGGALTEDTTITTIPSNDAASDRSLAIAGLVDTFDKTLETQNMIVEVDGTLRKVVKSLELDINVSNIATATGYSPNIEEIFVSFNNLTADVNLILPTASVANKGQVINVKILPATGAAADVTSHAGYLNLLDTYGSMFYQGWVLKSNGSEWTIVSRN